MRRWRDLADRLAERIESDEFPPGSKMPTTAELMAEGSQSRPLSGLTGSWSIVVSLCASHGSVRLSATALAFASR